MYIFEISCLSVAPFTIIFSLSEGCLFTLLIVSFVVQKLLILIRSHCLFLLLISQVLYDLGYVPILLWPQVTGMGTEAQRGEETQACLSSEPKLLTTLLWSVNPCCLPDR